MAYDEVAEGLKKAARRVFWEVGRLQKREPEADRYVLVHEECRRCDGGVIELLYLNGGLIAWHPQKEGTGCNDRCCEKTGGQQISKRSISEAEAEVLFPHLASS